MSTYQINFPEDLSPQKPHKQYANALMQWFGSALGIAGALSLAMNVSWSAYGWLCFLLSNIAWIAFAYRTRVLGLLIMQMVFMGTSLMGIYRWILVV